MGKSSLINFLTSRKRIALTSSEPGKTRLINHFLINDEWYLVDLPGYGYAKTGRSQKKKLLKIITGYITKRENLCCLFLLIDARHQAQEIDRFFIEWLGVNRIPFVLVFTKTDKISAEGFSRNRENYGALLLESWETLPPFFSTSVKAKKGRDEILDFIEQTNATVL